MSTPLFSAVFTASILSSSASAEYGVEYAFTQTSTEAHVVTKSDSECAQLGTDLDKLFESLVIDNTQATSKTRKRFDQLLSHHGKIANFSTNHHTQELTGITNTLTKDNVNNLNPQWLSSYMDYEEAHKTWLTKCH